MGVEIDAEITAGIISKLEGLPHNTTSSMLRDFRNKNATELNSLTKFVIDKGVELNIKTPTYDELYASLKSK
jgi:ketopantoate reductase